MNAVAQITTVLAGLVHVMIFSMESVLFKRPVVYSRFRTHSADVAAVRPWAYNQGWYNLFLAAGAIGGVVALHAGTVTATGTATGRAIALFSCACMAGAALILVTKDRRMLRGAVTQGLFPVLALVAVLF